MIRSRRFLETWLVALWLFGVGVVAAAPATPSARSTSSTLSTTSTLSTPSLELKDREIELLKRKLRELEGEHDRERIGRMIFEIQLQVTTIRLFDRTEPVQYATLTPQIMDRIVEQSLEDQYPGAAFGDWVWLHELFGAIPKGTDMVALIKSLMAEQAAGVYDPATKTFYYSPQFPIDSALGRMILAHEITHALQDQNYDLKKLGVELKGNDDRATAILSIAEGDAMLTMTEYFAQTGQVLSLLMDLPRMLTMDQSKYNAAPPAIRDMLLFPYLGGMNFFQSLSGRTRENPKGRSLMPPAWWRDQIFKQPPETTEQILHVEKYLSRELPATIAPLDGKGLKASTSNILGEFGLKLLLAPGAGGALASQAATGWNGDRVLIGDDPATGRRRIELVTRWDTPADADQFAQALKTALDARFAGRLAWRKENQSQQAETTTATLAIARPQSDAVDFRGTFSIEE